MICKWGERRIRTATARRGRWIRFLTINDDDDRGGGDTGAEDTVARSPPDSNRESAESVEPIRMPEGVREVLAEGIYVLVRAESGSTYLGTLGDTDPQAPLSSEELTERLTSFTLLDPYAAERSGDEEVDPGDLPTYAADAIALDAEGRVAMYSGTDGQVTRFDAAAGEFIGKPEALPAEAHDLNAADLALIAGKWVLLNPESGEIWQEGGDSAQAPLAGPGLLQFSAAASRDIYIADPAGLWRLSPGGEFERVASAEGEPARPAEIDGAIGAAWLGQQRSTLWTSAGGERTLSYDPSVQEGGDLTPVFRSNGDRAVLSDAQTGMLWTLRRWPQPYVDVSAQNTAARRRQRSRPTGPPPSTMARGPRGDGPCPCSLTTTTPTGVTFSPSFPNPYRNPHCRRTSAPCT